jgi:hypothetical protein
MARKVCLVLGIIISLTLCCSVWAQDPAVSSSPQATDVQAPPVKPEIPAAQAEAETQWLWGEAVSVAPQKNEVVVKYQDYDAEQEKEMTVAADDKTTFEEVKSLAEIQPKDILSVDYKVSADGRNIAKNISVEKAESSETVSSAVNEAPAAESVPESTPAPAAPASSEPAPAQQ